MTKTLKILDKIVDAVFAYKSSLKKKPSSKEIKSNKPKKRKN